MEKPDRPADRPRPHPRMTLRSDARNHQKSRSVDQGSVTQDTHRKIYVATTRARYRTIEVMSAPPPPSKRAAGKTAKSTTAKHIAGLT